MKNTSTQALVSEYWYNGLGHRITWHADTTRSGGGAPDGSVNTSDPKVHFVYNERWQQVAAYRQANGSGVDTHPKEQFVHHNAGHGGYGGSSYIDGVILRDDHEDDWTESADSTLERRVYYCQNWRADVVALLGENGRVVERAWYEPYGTPHGLNPGDFGGTSSSGDDHYLVPDGDSDSDDATTYLALFGGSNALSDTTGSSDPGDGEYGRPNGVIDSDDYFYFLDRASDAVTLGRNVLSAGHDGATASHGAGNLRNRRGLAGYEWDPHVRRYHVRHRVLYPEIGRWTRRDPLGYVDGMGLYNYGGLLALLTVDPSGLGVFISTPDETVVPTVQEPSLLFPLSLLIPPYNVCTQYCARTYDGVAPLAGVLCVNQAPYVCVCSANLRKALALKSVFSREALRGVRECVVHHEREHVGDVDCASCPTPVCWPGPPGGIPGDPYGELPWHAGPCVRECTEAKGWGSGMRCLQSFLTSGRYPPTEQPGLQRLLEEWQGISFDHHADCQACLDRLPEDGPSIVVAGSRIVGSGQGVE